MTEPTSEQTLVLLQRLADRSLQLWDIPAHARARLINVSENTTYLVEAAGFRAVLRIHREGYHSRNAISCELDWAAALDREGGVATPGVHPGRDGRRIQSGIVAGLTAPRHMVLFRFVPGTSPDPDTDPTGHFEELGGIAARTHLHSIGWPRRAGFERLTWDSGAVFGPTPTWGDWRAAPGVDSKIRKVLEELETTVKTRLAAFDKPADRYGLIHADMRLANLLVGPRGTRLIDFDDCGFGWFLYDFAAAISFIEDHPEVPRMKDAWIRGYRRYRALGQGELQEIDTFVMLRRMALLAWIGSHIEAPEPRALAPDFARVSAELGRKYLDRLA